MEKIKVKKEGRPKYPKDLTAEEQLKVEAKYKGFRHWTVSGLVREENTAFPGETVVQVVVHNIHWTELASKKPGLIIAESNDKHIWPDPESIDFHPYYSLPEYPKKEKDTNEDIEDTKQVWE